MLLLSRWVFVFAFFFFSFFLSHFFGSGMPGCCLHTAEWLFILLSVGINASFPAQRQSTLPAVHPGCLQDLVRRERKAQDVTQLALPSGRPTLCTQAGRDQPGWAGTSQAGPPTGLQCHTLCRKEDMQWKHSLV